MFQTGRRSFTPWLAGGLSIGITLLMLSGLQIDPERFRMRPPMASAPAANTSITVQLLAQAPELPVEIKPPRREVRADSTAPVPRADERIRTSRTAPPKLLNQSAEPTGQVREIPAPAITPTPLPLGTGSGSTIVIDPQIIKQSSQSSQSELHRNLQLRGAEGRKRPTTDAERFQSSVQGAGKPDCLKPPEGSAGSPLGLLALPFLVWDAAKGKCV